MPCRPVHDKLRPPTGPETFERRSNRGRAPLCLVNVGDLFGAGPLVRVPGSGTVRRSPTGKRNLNALFPRFHPIPETIGLQNTAFPPTVIKRETMARELVRFRGIIGHSVAMPWPHLRPDRF